MDQQLVTLHFLPLCPCHPAPASLARPLPLPPALSTLSLLLPAHIIPLRPDRQDRCTAHPYHALAPCPCLVVAHITALPQLLSFPAESSLCCPLTPVRYSWVINSLVGAVYMFGFILMCPQVIVALSTFRYMCNAFVSRILRYANTYLCLCPKESQVTLKGL